MFKKVFLDANILVDFADSDRAMHTFARELIMSLLNMEIELCTSCDIITTIYYLRAKNDKACALDEVSKINQFCTIIEFSNKEVEYTCKLMQKDSDFCDLEDTIQYVLAKKSLCDAIVSNDKNFISKDIKLMSSGEFVVYLKEL
jgi:predicted nucleic acid-binding protein